MTRKPENVTAVIFDLGATLVDFPIGESEEELIAKELGCQESAINQINLDFSWANRGQSTRVFLEFLHDSLAERGFPIKRALLESLCDRSIQQSFIQPDATAALQAIRRQGRKIAIVSNSNPLSHHRIDLHGLRALVDVVRLSCDTGLWKPDPRAYLGAVDQMETSPSETLIVGDRIRTLALGAIGVGMPIVLLDRGVRLTMLGDQLPFFAIFKSLLDLSEELGKI